MPDKLNTMTEYETMDFSKWMYKQSDFLKEIEDEMPRYRYSVNMQIADVIDDLRVVPEISDYVFTTINRYHLYDPQSKEALEAEIGFWVAASGYFLIAINSITKID